METIGPPRHRPLERTARREGLLRWALGLLLLVCAMNVLTSSGRWLLAAVSPLMCFELEISETQAAWLATVVLLTVAISSPLVGYVVDRFNRPRLLAMGFASGVWRRSRPVWLARTSNSKSRGLVGVGDAMSGVIGLTMIMDLFPAPPPPRADGIFPGGAAGCGRRLDLRSGRLRR